MYLDFVLISNAECMWFKQAFTNTGAVRSKRALHNRGML